MDDHERRVQEFHLNHPLLSIRSDPMIKDAKREPEHWSWIMISCWWNAPLLSDFVRSRSLWQTDDGISRGGGGRNVFRHFCDYERFSLFCFFSLIWRFFFFTNWMDQLFRNDKIQSVNNRVVSFRFDSNRGSESFFENVYRRGKKNCVWFRGWNRFLML